MFDIRRAEATDAESIAAAHLDSIRTIGRGYYEPAIVQDWGGRVEPGLYVRAMARGEVFFIAVDSDDHGASGVLGFSSHRQHGNEHGIAVYVRGSAARRGVGSALLRAAEAHALESGATTLDIDASLAAVDFYKRHGFIETGRGSHRLWSGRSMSCVFMQKRLDALPR